MLRQDTPMFRLILAGAILQAIFSIWPELDLRVSDMFRLGATRFPLARDPNLALLREILWESCLAVAFAVIVVAALRLVSSEKPVFMPGPCPFGRAALFLILGPGLLVNGLLKGFWGRMRPADVIELGGKGNFTPAFRMAGECTRNCSFVSGEAALGMATALVLWNLASWTGQARRPLAITLTVLVVVMAGLRLATGRHFLSDIVFACLFMAILAQIILPPVPKGVVWPRLGSRDGAAAPGSRAPAA